MTSTANGNDPLFRAGGFFVAARTAKNDIVPAGLERLFQGV